MGKVSYTNTKDRIYNMERIDMGNKLPTYCLKVVLTAEDIYEKLSDEDKKRFNRVIIAGVSRDLEMNLEITCVAVNDCPMIIEEH